MRHLESKRRKLTSKYVIPNENTENALNERLSKDLTGVSYKGRARNGLSQVGWAPLLRALTSTPFVLFQPLSKPPYALLGCDTNKGRWWQTFPLNQALCASLGKGRAHAHLLHHYVLGIPCSVWQQIFVEWMNK